MVACVMGRKRPERTARRARERAVHRLVQDREKLAALASGGSPEHPISVPSASVVEVRVRALACPQCEGEYQLEDHQTAGAGLRKVSVRCRLCHAARALWFRLEPAQPN